MEEAQKQDAGFVWQKQLTHVMRHLLRRWYLLLLGVILGGLAGYLKVKAKKPVYTASFSFVLSTDQRQGGGIANLAAQLGFDAITSSPDNIFSGDNIIELFKSRKLIGAALLSEVDKNTHQTLLNFIAQKNFSAPYNALGSFGKQPQTYSPGQKKLYSRIISAVGKSFIVFKRDKKLIVYILSATATDPDIAYHSARLLLDQTSKYFIETKTRVSASSVKLLQHEADSLGMVLRNVFVSTAATNDRTFNLNPAITVQRSGSLFNQARATAFAAAYTEVMRNLEIAKINLQKETPLYRIIDEPELPLDASRVSALKYTVVSAVIGFLIIAVVLSAQSLLKRT
ncbi:hypothetical protein KHS38_05485 [Mucilaginibacter sp. Bleaf8]|uniref:hypothetical protein n=1 Tax=Mucilaginibacter sp. Bleaf8 TaxID=2834430 RepID=UPI001BCC02C3|nr:hypothetical protein [Mucilaginibacter sp. Bleaf8]MBS7563849.1 hypothetical protein [Mucilaginibacter sp. Bleaf8]